MLKRPLRWLGYFLLAASVLKLDDPAVPVEHIWAAIIIGFLFIIQGLRK